MGSNTVGGLTGGVGGGGIAGAEGTKGDVGAGELARGGAAAGVGMAFSAGGSL